MKTIISHVLKTIKSYVLNSNVSQFFGFNEGHIERLLASTEGFFGQEVFTYDIDGEITGYKGWKRHVVIPMNAIIGEKAFMDSTWIVKITVSKGVTINKQAFCRSLGLKTIVISEGVDIKHSAFFGCIGLESITLSEGVTIADSAFAFCEAIKQLTIPRTVTVGDKTFWGCSNLMKVIVMGGSTLEASSFGACEKLTEVAIAPDVHFNELIEIMGSRIFQRVAKKYLMVPINQLVETVGVRCDKYTQLLKQKSDDVVETVRAYPMYRDLRINVLCVCYHECGNIVRDYHKLGVLAKERILIALMSMRRLAAVGKVTYLPPELLLVVFKPVLETRVYYKNITPTDVHRVEISAR